MQVDFRSEYSSTEGENFETKSVRALTSTRDFFVSESEQLTNNYASAKAEIALWIERVGHTSVYAQLERMRRGESFEVVAGMN